MMLELGHVLDAFEHLPDEAAKLRFIGRPLKKSGEARPEHAATTVAALGVRALS